MLDIWQICKGDKQIQTLHCLVWRIVESQYQNATRKLVDSREEHEILEQEIEAQKPALQDASQGYHYLLYTPFRYPPLKHGSRFGSRFERSLWYGSLNIRTALAEKAYYRFLLLGASDAKFKELPISYSAFQANIETVHGIDLTQTPFDKFKDEISKKDSYASSQPLGTKMREAKVEAFFFLSARCPKDGPNVALFAPQGFKENMPIEPYQTWQGTVTHSKTQMEFVRTNGLCTEIESFPRNIFLIDDELPNPAVN